MTDNNKDSEMSKTVIGWALEEEIELTDEVKELARKAQQEKEEAAALEEAKRKESLTYAFKQGLRENIDKIIYIGILIVAGVVAKYFDIPIFDLL